MSFESSTGVRTPTAPILVLEYLGGGIAPRHARPRGSIVPLPSGHPRCRGGPGSGLCPLTGPCPPRHQTRQPAFRRRRSRACRRFRRRPSTGRGGLDRACRGDGRHGPLRLTRVGRGQAGGRPGRRLLLGPGPLRGGDRHGALCHRHHHGHADGACRCPPAAEPSPRSFGRGVGPCHGTGQRGSARRGSIRGTPAALADALPNPQPLPLRTPHPDASTQVGAERPTPFPNARRSSFPQPLLGPRRGRARSSTQSRTRRAGERVRRRVAR